MTTRRLVGGYQVRLLVGPPEVSTHDTLQQALARSYEDGERAARSIGEHHGVEIYYDGERLPAYVSVFSRAWTDDGAPALGRLIAVVEPFLQAVDAADFQREIILG